MLSFKWHGVASLQPCVPPVVACGMLCGGSLKPGAVEHAGVSQGWTRERGLPHITSELNPQLLTLSPFLLVYSLLLRHCAGESMSLNLGPVFVPFSDNQRSNTLPYTYGSFSPGRGK